MGDSVFWGLIVEPGKPSAYVSRRNLQKCMLAFQNAAMCDHIGISVESIWVLRRFRRRRMLGYTFRRQARCHDCTVRRGAPPV